MSTEENNVADLIQKESEEMGLYDDVPRRNVLDKGFVRLIRSMGDDSSIVQCARTSYGKGTKTINEDRGLIRTLVRDRHTSPLESVIFTFHVKAPLFVVRQWQRHRMWSYNELSGRYSEMPEDCYVPKEEHVTKQDPINKQGGTDTQIPYYESDTMIYQILDDRGVSVTTWQEIFEYEQSHLKTFYQEYLKTGMRRELARINLPLSQYTEMYATCDLHNILHFLKLRLDKHAQYEIRVYAEAVLELMKPIIPVTIEAFEDYMLDGMYLSKQEIKILNELIGVGFNMSDMEKLPEQISSKRERASFIQKLDTLLSRP